jgi:hypothetical protein
MHQLHSLKSHRKNFAASGEGHDLFEWYFFLISGVGLWVLRPLLAYCTSPGWQVTVIVEKLVEWRFAGETEALRKDLPQRQFVHHKSHILYPGLNPGRRGGKPATNRLSYGAVFTWYLVWGQCGVPTTLTDVLSFIQCLQVRAPKFRSWSIHSTAFTIYCSILHKHWNLWVRVTNRIK